MGDNAELLTNFTAKLDEFELHQTFISRAKDAADDFEAKVIDRVVEKNTEKSLVVIEDLIPLMMDMEEVIATLTSEKEEALAGRETSGEQLEELELMKEIGELSEEDFDAQAKELKDSVGKIDEVVSGIDAELATFTEQLERWQVAGTAAGVLSDEEDEPEVAVEAAAAADDDGDVDIVDIDDGDDDGDEINIDEEPELAGFESATSSSGVHGGPTAATTKEDMSVVFGDDDDDGIDLDVGDIDIIGDDDDGIEIEVAADDDDGPRRAVLLYQEGTAEEQIYPINGDILTLGRGRDNDVQVKNDSKVSRYHCKVYRRGPNFYVEDNKSANGTLVNGELITERRLFGGEEVIIGETFFRFRIMD